MRSISVSILLLAITASSAQWATIPYPYFGFQRAVHFLDANTGYVGAYGRVRKTTDGGTTWSPAGLTGPDQVILNVLDIMAVHAINPNTVVVGGTNNALGTEMIARTSDGGALWEIVHTGPGGSELNDLHFPSTTIGYAVGANGRILKTVDGGVNWSAQSSGSGNELGGVFFRDPLRGMAVGDGVVLKTTDGGSTWTSMALSGYLVGIEAFGTSSWVASGNNGECWLSEDNGATWEDRSLPLSASTSRLTVSAGGRISLAAESAIYVTDNLGLLWERYPLPANVSYVNDIQATAALGGVGFAVSEGGKVLKSTNVSGPAHPIALFQPSNYTACVGIPISFQNLSSPTYTSTWKVDGVVVGTSTDLSTAFNQAGTAEVRLVVSNGFFTDSTNQYISVVNIPGPAPAPTVVTFPANVCPGNQMTIQVNNSTPNVLYQVHVNGVPYGGPMGGGSWSFQFPSMTTQLGAEYTVVSSRVTPCGTFIDGTFPVPINIVPYADPNVEITLTPTVMCDPGVPVLTISPSQVGINYRVSGQYYPGNGGTLSISLPVPFQSTTYVVVGRNALNCDINMATAPTLTYAPMDPNFTLNTTTPFVGQTVNVINNSAAVSYAWNLGVNAAPSSSSAPSPSMSYSTTGPDTITVYMANAEGCDRTVKRGIHVYEPAPVDGGEACRVTLSNFQAYGVQTSYHYVMDQHVSSADGATYLCGFISQSTGAGNTFDYFLMKFNADGDFLWEQRLNPMEYLGTSYSSSFAAAVTTDTDGNIYMGGSLSGRLLRFGSFSYSYSQSYGNPFIVKMDPDGNALWVMRSPLVGIGGQGTTDLLRLEDGSLYAIMKTSGSGSFLSANGASTIFSTVHRDKLVRFDPDGNILQVEGFGPLMPVSVYNAGMYNHTQSSWSGTQTVTVAPRMKAMPDGRIAICGDIVYDPNSSSGTMNVNIGSTVLSLEQGMLSGGYIAVYDPASGWVSGFKTHSSAEPTFQGTGRSDERVFPAFAVDTDNNISTAVNWDRRTNVTSRFILGDGTELAGDSGSVWTKWSADGQLLWARHNNNLLARDMAYTNGRFALLAEYKRFLGLVSSAPPSLGTSGNGSLDLALAYVDDDGDVQSVRPLASNAVDRGHTLVAHPCGGVQFVGTAGGPLTVSGLQLNGSGFPLYLMRYGSQQECAAGTCPEITLNVPRFESPLTFNVFPNPANASAWAQLPSGMELLRTIEAIDASGRVIPVLWQAQGDGAIIETAKLGAGIYALRITDQTGQQAQTSLAVAH